MLGLARREANTPGRSRRSDEKVDRAGLLTCSALNFTLSWDGRGRGGVWTQAEAEAVVAQVSAQ